MSSSHPPSVKATRGPPSSSTGIAVVDTRAAAATAASTSSRSSSAQPAAVGVSATSGGEGEHSRGAASAVAQQQPTPAPVAGTSAAQKSGPEYEARKVNARQIVNKLEERIRVLSADLEAAQSKNIKQSKKHKLALQELEAKLEVATTTNNSSTSHLNVSADSVEGGSKIGEQQAAENQQLKRDLELVKRERDAALADAKQNAARAATAALQAKQGSGGAADPAVLAEHEAQLKSLETRNAALELELKEASQKLAAQEKKANLLATRLVTSLRRDQYDETAEIGFVLRMLEDEREAVETIIKSLSEHLEIELPYSNLQTKREALNQHVENENGGNSSEAAVESAKDKLMSGDTLERGTRILNQLHVLEMGVRQRAVTETQKMAKAQRVVSLASETAQDGIRMLKKAAVTLIQQEQAFTAAGGNGAVVTHENMTAFEAGGIGADDAAGRARSLGTTTTMSVGQSPNANKLGGANSSILTSAAGGAEGGDGFIEPTPPRNSDAMFDGTSPSIPTGALSGAHPISSATRGVSGMTSSAAARVLPLVPPASLASTTAAIGGGGVPMGTPHSAFGTPAVGSETIALQQQMYEAICKARGIVLEAVEFLDEIPEAAATGLVGGGNETSAAAAAGPDAQELIELDALAQEFDEYRRASQASMVQLAERLDREVMRHHSNVMDMKQRVSFAEGEYTKLLLETQHVSPQSVEQMQLQFLEATRAAGNTTTMRQHSSLSYVAAESRIQTSQQATVQPPPPPPHPQPTSSRLPPVVESSLEPRSGAPPSSTARLAPPSTTTDDYYPFHHTSSVVTVAPSSVNVSAVLPASAHTSIQRRRGPIVSPDF